MIPGLILNKELFRNVLRDSGRNLSPRFSSLLCHWQWLVTTGSLCSSLQVCKHGSMIPQPVLCLVSKGGFLRTQDVTLILLCLWKLLTFRLKGFRPKIQSNWWLLWIFWWILTLNMEQKRSQTRFLSFLSWSVRAHHPEFISEPSFHCCCRIRLSYTSESSPLLWESQPKVYWFNLFHFHVLFDNMCAFNKASKRWGVTFHLKST